MVIWHGNEHILQTLQEMAPMQCSPYYHVLSCGPLGGAKETEGMDMRHEKAINPTCPIEGCDYNESPKQATFKDFKASLYRGGSFDSLAPLFCLWSFLNETLPCCPVLLRTQQWHFGGLPDSKSPILATLVPSEERITLSDPARESS